MAGKNRYFCFAKISEVRFRSLLRCFALDLTATQTAALAGLSVRRTNDLFQRLRQRLAAECAKVSPFKGELEADESYFGARRVRGRRGRGAAGKTIVFGLLKRGDQVYTEIVPNASKAALQAVIRHKASLESIIHTDKWRGYDGRSSIWALRSTAGSTMATTSLPSVQTTSTVSRVSGAMPKLGWQSSAACAERLFPSI